MLQQREPTKIEQQIEREAWLAGLCRSIEPFAIDIIISSVISVRLLTIPSTCIIIVIVNHNKCGVAKLAL